MPITSSFITTFQGVNLGFGAASLENHRLNFLAKTNNDGNVFNIDSTLNTILLKTAGVYHLELSPYFIYAHNTHTLQKPQVRIALFNGTEGLGQIFRDNMVIVDNDGSVDVFGLQAVISMEMFFAANTLLSFGAEIQNISPPANPSLVQFRLEPGNFLRGHLL